MNLMSSAFSWYEEDVTAFLLSLDLPVYRKDTPMLEALQAEKTAFETHFQDVLCQNKFRAFSNTFYDSLVSLLSEISSIFQSLIDIICFYDTADMASAQFEFEHMMDSLLSHLFISNIYWPYLPTTFYRVRASSNEKLKAPKDLFHIPYKKRHLVSNERYSLAGHPCLYLASQLYVAWQECGYPHEYYYSEFQYQDNVSSDGNTDEWKFITFLSPRRVALKYFVAINQPEDKYLNLAQSCLLSYPLMFACSIVNLNGNSAFKPEYVIPQMLTQWVYRHYEAIKGIKYFSCFDADDTRVYNGFNVVMPVKNIDYRRGFSKDLIEQFKVSNPILIHTGLSAEEGAIIKRYKKDLLDTMRSTFREASDCLFDLYLLADLLDKAINNVDNSDMRLVISTVRNVARGGKRLLEEYSKTEIIERYRASATYSDRVEDKIKSFCSIFDRFKTETIDIAESFDSLIDRIPSHKNDEFFVI